MNGLKRYVSLLFLLTAIFTIVIINLSCEDNPVTPGDPPPGSRDYVWTIDTIDAPYNTYYRMWASSPEDIWLVGQGDWEHSIAHYDGISWSTYGVPRMNVAASIFGFSGNNVYIGTAGGGIWNYDGSSWQKVTELTKDGRSDIFFDNIWGRAPNEIYAFGAYPEVGGAYNKSVIAQFIDGNWSMINTDALYGVVEHLYGSKTSNQLYMQVLEMGGGEHFDSTHIWEYSEGQYQKIYANIWTKGLQADISLINDEVFFVLGNRITTRANNQFNTVVNVDNPNFYQRIWGRSSNDIFLLMTDGLVHYNGNDMEYLFYFNITPRTQIYGAALFEDEVFFIVDEARSNLNLIYHGKLTEE